MSIGFFLVGGVIFSFYVYFLIWNIFYSTRKQREENYPSTNLVDNVDMDGNGNWGRFVPEKKRPTKRLVKSRKKVKV